MILNKTRNTINNIKVNFVNKLLNVLLPFVSRTILIKTLGMDYLGLSSLFTSILSVLNLSELGIGVAIVYSMYEPISNDDYDEICALLKLYKKIYFIIGCIILLLGVSMLPFLDFFVKSSIPEDVNIKIIFIVYLINTVLSYWMFAYKKSLFLAFQTEYKININLTIVKCCEYVIGIIVLVLFKNYYCFLITLPIFTIISNVVIELVARKNFSKYELRGNVSENTLKKIKKSTYGILIGKINDVARNSLDNIVISAFLGLTLVAKYNNYYYIINTVSSFLLIVHGAMVAGVGNSILVDTEEKNYSDFKMFLFAYMWMSGWCMCCIVCLIRPFIFLWVGKDNSFGVVLSFLMGIYFYAVKMGDMLSVYKTAKGIWWEERWKTLVESIFNIVLNIILVKMLGVYGVIISTIITVAFINFPWGAYIGYRFCFPQKSIIEYYIIQMKYFICSSIICLVTYVVTNCIKNNSFVFLIIRGLECLILPNCLFWLVYRRTNVYKQVSLWIENKAKCLRTVEDGN